MRRLAAPTIAALLGCGCPLFGSAAGGPCDDDRFECDDGEFALDPECTLDETLAVAIGQGTDAYSPLFEGESPVVYYGPQGGQHVILGVRVANPALERYDRVRVTFAIHPADACPEDEPSCMGTAIAQREAVPGSVEPLATEDGAIEEYGMVVVLAGLWEQALVIDVLVEDPCGQSGRAQHRFVGVE
jgi:hypothetical protein